MHNNLYYFYYTKAAFYDTIFFPEDNNFLGVFYMEGYVER